MIRKGGEGATTVPTYPGRRGGQSPTGMKDGKCWGGEPHIPSQSICRLPSRQCGGVRYGRNHQTGVSLLSSSRSDEKVGGTYMGVHMDIIRRDEGKGEGLGIKTYTYIHYIAFTHKINIYYSIQDNKNRLKLFLLVISQDPRAIHRKQFSLKNHIKYTLTFIPNSFIYPRPGQAGNLPAHHAIKRSCPSCPCRKKRKKQE